MAATSIDAIVAIVRDLEPHLSVRSVEAIIAACAETPLMQRRLQLALEGAPGILVGEQENVPVRVQSLCAALVDAGAKRVVRPACAMCGRVRTLPSRARNGGRLCARCEKTVRSVPCHRCRQVRPIQRRIGAERLCRPCWREDPRSEEECSKCGQEAPVAVRRPARLCFACYEPPQHECGFCGRRASTTATIDGRKTCQSCYHAMRQPRICPTCNQRHHLTFIREGVRVCAGCAGESPYFACPKCGSTSEYRKGALCARCRRPTFVQELLSDTDGQVRPELEPLRVYLTHFHPAPASLFRWAIRKKNSALIRELARGDVPLNAPAIIAHINDPQRSAFALSLLKDAGVLDGIDIEQLLFDSWWASWIPTLPRTDALILRRYNAWGSPNRRTRHDGRTGRRTTTYQRHRHALTRCAAFLAMISTTGHTLATVPQRLVDTYIVEHPGHSDSLAVFTRWLRKHRLSTVRVAFHDGRHVLAGKGVEVDHRWEMTRKFLADRTMHPADRTAALLVLLYGVMAERVLSLRLDDIDIAGNEVAIRFGSEPLLIPPVLADSVIATVAQARDRRSEWLFPGRQPGTPLSRQRLSKRLLAHGMKLHSARVTALMQLAAQLPPRVLSDLLGISESTAAEWWRLAGGDWNDYAALRNPPPTRADAS